MGISFIPGVGTTDAPLISVVDDDDSVRSSLVLLLRSRGFRSRGYASGEAFLAAQEGLASQCVVMDVRLKGMGGLELQTRIRSTGQPVPVIFISAHRDDEAVSRALGAGARGFLIKPFAEEALLSIIAAALGA